MSLDVALVWCGGDLEDQDAAQATTPHEDSEANILAHREDFEANITHNLRDMAIEAGIYRALWRPEEIGITRGVQLIEPLTQGLARLKSNPEHFRAFDNENKWGTYDQFVPWIERYIDACKAFPQHTVWVSR